MRCKNIAVIITAIDSDGQAEILKGIEEYGKNHNCNIAVFLWFTGVYEEDKHNMGEVNIIELPDLNLFDGIILVANTMHMGYNRKKIEGLLDKVTCPVICIGYKYKNSIYVGADNYTAMRKLVEHFVVDHKMTRLHFVKGVEGNVDAKARFQAYVDVLTEHDIPIVQERITQGDFYVAGGERAAEDILNSTLPFPEVIICANDIMAITVCDILEEKGYNVPQDVAVSGYDYSLEGQYHFPRLTTVRSCFDELGVRACKALLDTLDGKEVEKEILLSDEVVLDESCGCCVAEESNIAQRQLIWGGADILQRKMIYHMTMLEKQINESSEYKVWLSSLKEFIANIDPPEFYCCMNVNFVNDVFEDGAMEQEDMSTEERLAYSSIINVILAYKDGVFCDKESFESQYAFDELFKDASKGRCYIFSPIHYLERNFGYFVFVDSTFPYANPLYVNWLINMGTSIENIRRQTLLKNAMNRLDEMYIRDSLTGAYNRFGMERYFVELKKKCLMSRVFMQLSFADIDNLKETNDKYGHAEGDRIINAAAEILQRVDNNYYIIRYGGDEFIIMGMANDSKEIERYWQSVQKEVQRYNSTQNTQAELSISYGYELFAIEPNTFLENCIQLIDEKMYMDKSRKKEKRKKNDVDNLGDLL